MTLSTIYKTSFSCLFPLYNRSLSYVFSHCTTGTFPMSFPTVQHVPFLWLFSLHNRSLDGCYHCTKVLILWHFPPYNMSFFVTSLSTKVSFSYCSFPLYNWHIFLTSHCTVGTLSQWLFALHNRFPFLEIFPVYNRPLFLWWTFNCSTGPFPERFFSPYCGSLYLWHFPPHFRMYSLVTLPSVQQVFFPDFPWHSRSSSYDWLFPLFNIPPFLRFFLMYSIPSGNTSHCPCPFSPLTLKILIEPLVTEGMTLFPLYNRLLW